MKITAQSEFSVQHPTSSIVAALALLVPLAATPTAYPQAPASLGIETYAGLAINGTVGTVFAIEYVRDLVKTNENDWHCLAFFQLPATNHLWFDQTLPVRGQRFYRAVQFEQPTNMVFIPPGTYKEGSPDSEPDPCACEHPQTTVIISRGFWMGIYEVTQEEYRALMGTNPSYFNGGNYGIDLRRPVERVSWDDANNYCDRLTKQQLAAGRIPVGTGYRLPTMAEWQYACRAWTSTRFSYGDDPAYTDLANYAWYKDNSGGMTWAVGLLLPNPWGLYDMHGNVWEWCQDWYQGFRPWLPGGIVVDPQGPATGTSRMVGGGAFNYPGEACRSAVWNNFPQDYGSDGQIGFRVVLAAIQP